MNQTLRDHADRIVRDAIQAVLPDAAVKRALDCASLSGRVLLVAVGKAAWQMAKTASDVLKDRIEAGVVITKYGHVMGPIANFTCFEAGHPMPDANTFKGTQVALDLVCDLSAQDTVLFLLSGGGSALFEQPLIPEAELQDITAQLLGCGADITEINTIRKRLSAVKGGRFAQLVHPAKIEAIVLSDVLGDPLDMIASGPACPDSSTAEDAWRVVQTYRLRLSEAAQALLNVETPKTLDNVHTQINGSVRELCAAAAKSCEQLGYTPILLTDRLCCQAREAGSFLASILKTHAQDGRSLAFIAGGETVVKLTGNGLGGRNQELALSAAPILSGMPNAAVFSVGSDGTDGPTDAAGGYADGNTLHALNAQHLSLDTVLQNNDSYHALQAVNGLIFTGPTGTNVNDISIALLKA